MPRNSYTTFRFEHPEFFQTGLEYCDYKDIYDSGKTEVQKIAEIAASSSIEISSSISVPTPMTAVSVRAGKCVNPRARKSHLDYAAIHPFQLFWSNVIGTEFTSATLQVSDRFLASSSLAATDTQMIDRLGRRITMFNPGKDWIEILSENKSKYARLAIIEDVNTISQDNAVAIGRVFTTLHRAPVATYTPDVKRYFSSAFISFYQTSIHPTVLALD